MISPAPSPTFTHSRCILGKPRTTGENPALSPKRFFAQQEQDQLSQLQLKRRQAYPSTQPSRRVPLDPLSTPGLKNRRYRAPQVTESYYSFVTPSSVSDLRVLLPEEPVSAGSCAMQRSGTSSVPVCSWPPPVPAPGPGGSSHSSLAGQHAPQCAPPYSSDSERESSRATFPESTLTWNALDVSQTEPTTTMAKRIPTIGWTSENVLSPIRARTNSMPFACGPPGELWRSDSGSTKAIFESIDTVDPFACPTPSGLPPRRAELRRSGSCPDLLSPGSVSLSLALGSQPLRSSDHTKAVSPIGAERRAVSMTSRSRNSPTTKLIDPPQSPWCSPPLSPRLQARWNHDVYLLDTTALEKVQAVASRTNVSKEELERLLRHAVRSKYAPKIISPLSPLRTVTPALDMSTDPEYQLRMPSPVNNPSPRYAKCPSRRAHTICDGYQSTDWDTTCMHCQECQRDTLCKKLLAFRYRQQRTHHVQRAKLQLQLPLPLPAFSSLTGPSGMEDDRTVLADRIREVFAYEMDEEEKSLWEEVAAVTGAGPLPLSRVGVPCATAAHRDDGAHEEHLEAPDASASAALFRDVTVY